MQLPEYDEAYYRQCCLDLTYDLGADIVREGGEAKLGMGISGADKTVIARPTDIRHFWEDTWYAMRAAFPPKGP